MTKNQTLVPEKRVSGKNSHAKTKISRKNNAKSEKNPKNISKSKRQKTRDDGHRNSSKKVTSKGSSRSGKELNNSRPQSTKSRKIIKSRRKHSDHHRRSSDNNEDIINGSEIDIVDDDYDSEQNYSDNYNSDENSGEETPIVKLEDKTKERLKKKIIDWLDYDDKIKTLNAKAKKYKDAKKQQEELILKMISKLGVNDTKIDVHNDDDQLRGRVYRHKSTTKAALKENIVQDALMEVFRDEKKVAQLLKKIDSKRPINERYYLKRTKGNKDE